MSEIFFKACGICVISVLCITIFRQLKQEGVIPLRLAAVAVMSVSFISLSSPVIEYLNSILPDSGVSEYISLIIKALGIAFVSHVCASVCRDCGENTLAGYAELAGKAEILILSLPIVKDILDTAMELLEVAA